MTEHLSARAMSMVLLAVLAVGSVFAFRVLASDLLFFSIEREVVFWGTSAERPTSAMIAAAQQRIDQTLRYWPDHPDYLAMQARLHAWQGLVATDRLVADAHFKRALASLRLALVDRPGNPYSWAQYAEYLYTQPDNARELAAAVEKVGLLGRGDPRLQQRMAALTPQ